MVFAILWTVKFIPSTSIVFPLVLLAIAAFRNILSLVFTVRELRILDDLLPGQIAKDSSTADTTG